MLTQPPHGVILSTMAKPGALATLNDSDAIQQIASGKLLKHIAAQYGVAKQSLWERLQKHPGWQSAVALQAETFVELATDEAMSLDATATMPDIARARVKVDTAHRWAAARDPAAWGQRTQVTVEIGGDLAAALADARDRVRAAIAVPQEKNVSERSILAEFTQVPDK